MALQKKKKYSCSVWAKAKNTGFAKRLIAEPGQSLRPPYLHPRVVVVVRGGHRSSGQAMGRSAWDLRTLSAHFSRLPARFSTDLMNRWDDKKIRQRSGEQQIAMQNPTAIGLDPSWQIYCAMSFMESGYEHLHGFVNIILAGNCDGVACQLRTQHTFLRTSGLLEQHPRGCDNDWAHAGPVCQDGVKVPDSTHSLTNDQGGATTRPCYAHAVQEKILLAHTKTTTPALGL